jgi:pimeloyl-ACP methyl ester carboxylesterase
MRRTIDLGMHVQDIVGVIRCEELSDVVLCGHSYGGMVIAGPRADRGEDPFVGISRRLRARDGKSLFDYWRSDE